MCTESELCVIIGDMLQMQYMPSSRATFDGKSPSSMVAPRRTATTADIQSYEEKLFSGLQVRNAEM
jgi:hypothetical protein